MEVCCCYFFLAGLSYINISRSDFRPSNILLQTTGLDGLSEAEVLKAFGYEKPSTNPVNSAHVSSKRFALCVPRYLIKPVDFSRMNKRFLKDEIYLMDFGVSYTIPSPPKRLGLPRSYRTPEAILDGNIGIPCDLLALGYTLFEIRTGSKPIDISSNDIDQYLARMAKLLGPFPEPWWTTNWQIRREFFKDKLEIPRIASLTPNLGGWHLISRRIPKQANSYPTRRLARYGKSLNTELPWSSWKRWT